MVRLCVDHKPGEGLALSHRSWSVCLGAGVRLTQVVVWVLSPRVRTEDCGRAHAPIRSCGLCVFRPEEVVM